MNMKKHIAKTNTDQRCVVLFMQLPGREDHALICPTEGLPERMEQAVMEVVESPEGQNNTVLANVMSRRLLPDTGENLMEALHKRGYLRPIHVDLIQMLPLPNMPFPLRDIIEKMGGRVPTTAQAAVNENAESIRFNPHANMAATETSDEARGTAQNLLAEADLLMNEARSKMAKAYRMAPELAPVEATTGLRSTAEILEEKAPEPASAPKATRKRKA